MSEISNEHLRLQALQLAATTNPFSTQDLLSSADKIYTWLTQDKKMESPAWKEGFDERKNQSNENR